MEPVDKLLDKFWKGETTPEENKLLDKLLPEVDWEEVSAPPDASLKGVEGSASAILQRIHQRIQPAAPTRGRVLAPTRGRVLWLSGKTAWWAAASIVFLLCGYWLWHRPRPQQQQPVVAAKTAPPQQKRELRRISNSGQTILHLHLEDGSLVRLEPNSAISYYEPFGSSTRDISLYGEAYFAVAKDVARSFTVYADDIATTALGTAFTVNNRVKDSIAVKLYEGKVAVRSTGMGSEGVVYLRPGEEYKWDRSRSRAVVRHFERHHPDSHRWMAAPTDLSFQKEPLEKVFDKISKLYDVSFRYDDRRQMQRLRFTGAFKVPADSLSTILAVICNMSELQYTRQGDQITISKPK